MKKNILFVAIILVSSTNIVLSFPTMPQKSTVVDQLMSLNEKDLKKENVSTNIKFIYSEKATKFCEISTLLLTPTT